MPAMPPGPIVVDSSGLAADAVSIALLARLQLAARRLDRRVLLRNPPADLRRLIAFVGLDDVLRVEA
jgi:hypothetical protein